VLQLLKRELKMALLQYLVMAGEASCVCLKGKVKVHILLIGFLQGLTALVN